MDPTVDACCTVEGIDNRGRNLKAPKQAMDPTVDACFDSPLYTKAR
jgi:hypothetical protein